MLDPPLTERATADRSWLQSKLGRRLGEPWIHEGLTRWCVELTRVDGKSTFYFGTTLEDVYRALRSDAEQAIEQHRRARALR